MLNLTAWKRHKLVAFQKVEHALSQQIRNNTYMVAEIEAVAEMYALVAVKLVVV